MTKRPDALLLLVGDGELKEQLKEEVNHLGIEQHVLFLGERVNVADYYQAMDAFVFPSLWEGLGIAVIEAQAAGLPCVVSDKVPKAVDIGAGLVTFMPLKSPSSEWAKAIKSINRTDTSQSVRKRGYDIRETATCFNTFMRKSVAR